MIKLGYDLYMQARAGITEIHFLPFNPTEKRTALTYVDNTGKWYRASKGAPEQVHFHFRTICIYGLKNLVKFCYSGVSSDSCQSNFHCYLTLMNYYLDYLRFFISLKTKKKYLDKYIH